MKSDAVAVRDTQDPFNKAAGAIPETAVGFLRWRRSRYDSNEPAVHTKCGMDAPLNPANQYNPDVPFAPLDGRNER